MQKRFLGLFASTVIVFAACQPAAKSDAIVAGGDGLGPRGIRAGAVGQRPGRGCP